MSHTRAHSPGVRATILASGVARQKRQSKLGLWNSLCTTEPTLLEVIKWVSKVQSTPVISCQLGTKIRERELSGSPVISRESAKAQTRDFQDQSHTLWRLHLLNTNSMLSDNGCTYISRISADVDIAPATNHNKPYYILIIMHQKLSNYMLHKAAYANHDAGWQETEIASSLVAGFTETVWAFWWKIRELRFK